MEPQSPRTTPPAAGGCLIALGVIGGAVAGTFVNQISLGIILGLAAGAALALILYLIDRHR